MDIKTETWQPDSKKFSVSKIFIISQMIFLCDSDFEVHRTLTASQWCLNLFLITSQGEFTKENLFFKA